MSITIDRVKQQHNMSVEKPSLLSEQHTTHYPVCISSGEQSRTPWRVSVPRRGTLVNETPGQR